MTWFTRYTAPEVGFRTIAGRDDGLSSFVLAAGVLPSGAEGPVHVHHGDELLRILEGEVDVVVAGNTRRCASGDVVILPQDTIHGFRTLLPTRMEVVAALDAGQLLPVVNDGGLELVEVYRQDLPWSRRPPEGFDWTSDSRMADLEDRAP